MQTLFVAFVVYQMLGIQIDAKPSISTENTYIWDKNCGHSIYTGLVPEGPTYPEIQGRMIVGGQDAKLGEIPWQVSLRYRDGTELYQHFCGAVLITNQWIITAAHCVQNRSPSEISAVLGEHNSHVTNPYRQIRHVSQIILHPDYNRAAMLDADLALLRLAEPAEYSEWLQPVCPPQVGETYEGSMCVVSGWGTTQHGSYEFPDTLQVVSLPVPSNSECQQAFGGQYTITPGMVCAGNIPEYTADACQNDSGGPMTVQDPHSQQHQLVGIVSWGKACASGPPGVYTRLTEYMDWIHLHLGH